MTFTCKTVPSNVMTFTDNFKIAYQNLYNLYPTEDNKEFRFRYLKVDWFFPNHMHNVLDKVRDFGEKYFADADLEVALFGALFHDAGLVYERNAADPKGHENRSVEYTRKELEKLGYGNDFIGKVSECIRATEREYETTLPEALLVRNADAYAHLMSMHFFAKANFTEDIHEFIDWFERKLETTFTKITIPDLKGRIEPLVVSYREMIRNYKMNKDRDFLKEFAQ